MADALLQVVFENLNTLIQNEYGLLRGVDGEIKKLSKTLSMIRDFLKDAEEQEFKSKTVSNWLTNLKDVAYDADDLLDECATRALQAQVESGIRRDNQVCSSYKPLSCFEQVMFRHKMGIKIKNIQKEIDEIAAEMSKFQLSERFVERQTAEIQVQQTDSDLAEPEVYGREEDLKNIVEFLVTSNQEGLSIYSIIGMAGLGKTTLAKLAYNDEWVKTHFELVIWVCVSQDFDEPRLVKDIIESIDGNACVPIALDPMKRLLKEKLSGKKFLLVLDDVWNDDQDKWDRLKHLFTCGDDGSKIIVTTRSQRVADVMNTLFAHSLKGLSEEDCWCLFKQRAFGVDSGEEHQKLVAIGKEIVKKCGGVPLAAKALGGLLRSKRDESYWSFVKESEIWDLEDENHILPALKLSYNHLPSNLKRCFAYCSIFPQDYRIEVQTLIHLWMANGFLSLEGRSDLEAIGQWHFNELLQRSFFQDVEKDDDGNIIACKMHDLVHDLAQSIMRDECYIMGASREACDPKKKIRHSALICDKKSSSIILKALYKYETLRTLILEFYSIPKYIPDYTFAQNRCLRVLDLRNTGITKLSHSIGNLIHLRYLNLSYTGIETLPESMTSLQNLQTLILKYCNLCELPNDIKKMSSLRYLDIAGCRLNHMPSMIGQLNCLKTLTVFIVGKESGWSIRELKGLNLRGELEIKNLNNVRNKDASEANLIRKENLLSLKLSWDSDSNSQENADEVLEGLQPHRNLKRLQIENYVGIQFPSWLRDLLLPNLVEISMDGCKRCEHLPPLGQLRLLRELTIEDMPNLGEWPRVDRTELFPCLVELKICKCPKLTTLPCMSSLKRLHVEQCDPTILRLVENFTGLSSLRIGGFELRNLSVDLDNLVALESLTIKFCEELVSLPSGIGNLSSLKSLSILCCNSLISLPNEGLRGLCSLQSLFIDGCDSLRSLPEGLQYLTTLQDLLISRCSKLKHFPQGLQHLIKLRSVSIYNSSDLIAATEGLESLPSLCSLHIGSCPNLTSLPEGLQHLTALQNLLIAEFPKLTCLPEGWQHLTALQSLEIHRCGNLTCFPEGLQHLTALQSLLIMECPKLTCLPEGLQRLTALESLEIIDCPILERRCTKERGKDWRKIRHIPYFHIQPSKSSLKRGIHKLISSSCTR